MSILNKLQFWKRDDDFSTPSAEPPAYDLGAQHTDPLQQPDPMAHHDPFQQADPFGQQFGSQAQPAGQFGSQPQFTSQQYANAQFPGSQQVRPVPEQYHEQADPGVHQRDVELILAKLDAIKSELDALHQRVRKIEQAADQTQSNQKKYW